MREKYLDSLHHIFTLSIYQIVIYLSGVYYLVGYYMNGGILNTKFFYGRC